LRKTTDQPDNSRPDPNAFPVSGRRSGPAAMTLQGRTSLRSYQISGTVRGNILSLRYLVTRLDKGGPYKGESTLTLSR